MSGNIEVVTVPFLVSLSVSLPPPPALLAPSDVVQLSVRPMDRVYSISWSILHIKVLHFFVDGFLFAWPISTLERWWILYLSHDLISLGSKFISSLLILYRAHGWPHGIKYKLLSSFVSKIYNYAVFETLLLYNFDAVFHELDTRIFTLVSVICNNFYYWWSQSYLLKLELSMKILIDNYEKFSFASPYFVLRISYFLICEFFIIVSLFLFLIFVELLFRRKLF